MFQRDKSCDFCYFHNCVSISIVSQFCDSNSWVQFVKSVYNNNRLCHNSKLTVMLKFLQGLRPDLKDKKPTHKEHST